jgi:very-short-patch-repair endonuclease
MRRLSATDPAIAALAEDQHGVVTRSQLLVLGFTEGGIDRRLRARRLNRIHYGVYAVGHRVLTVEGRWMAAVLAGGAAAVLSHVSAAAAWEMRPVGSGAIHVTIPGTAGRARRAGMRVHRSTTLGPQDVTTHRGIPITDPHRTLADLARTLKGRSLEQAVNRAEHLIDFARLKRSAPPSLQAVLSRYTTATTRSELEEAFLRLCDAQGLPRPETNARIEGMEVDFVWRERRLIVEVDGYAHHRSPTAFERDRERDVVLTTKGWQVMRFTHAHITRRATWVADAVRTGAPRPSA